MRKGILSRTQTGPEGTFGLMTLDSGFECYSGELPYLDNAPNRSCIPIGVYICNKRWSEKHKAKVYHVECVKGRSDIEIHSANWCGDTTQGFKSQILGCIILGFGLGKLEGQTAILHSKKAIEAFNEDLGDEPFELEIKWVHNVGPRKEHEQDN